MTNISNQIFYNTVGNSVTLFCQWVIMMIIPKITDFSDAGIFAVALSLCSIFNIIATFFLNQYQISDQYQKYSESDYHTCRVLTIGISFVLCIVAIILFNYSIEQSLVILFYMLYRNYLHYSYLHTATLQIENRLDYVGKCMIIEGIISLISFTVTYTMTKNLPISVLVMALMGGGIFYILVSIGYRKTTGRYYPVMPINREKIIPMMKLGTPLLISGVAPIIITAIPKLALQSFWNDELVGIFSTLSAPTIIIPTLVIGLFTPFIVYFSNLGKNKDIVKIRQKYLLLVLLIVVFGLVSLIVSVLFAEFFFELLYGPEIVPYVKYFNILVIGIVIYSIGICGITVLITKEQGKYAAIATGISLFASFILFMLTIPEYGIDAASYGLIAAYGLFSLLISLFVLVKPIE